MYRNWGRFCCVPREIGIFLLVVGTVFIFFCIPGWLWLVILGIVAIMLGWAILGCRGR